MGYIGKEETGLDYQIRIANEEWERIKNDEAPRFSICPPPGKAHCNVCRSTENPKLCSVCKLVYFCSPECFKKAWKVHKVVCPGFQRDAEVIPLYNEVLNQFPWTDIGYNDVGFFSELFVLAHFGLLGTSRQKVGYWAAYPRAQASTELLDAPWNRLSEEQGWRMAKEFIPTLALQNSDKCPSFPPKFESNWSSYYEWRRLPIESPAAMLLHWPLSVYACLKELNLGPQIATSPRQKLTVFYVGAREEVHYIPVFGELALLYSNADLDLVMFGETTKQSVERAKARGLAKADRPCVFEYTAPEACGGGTVRVFIDSNPSYTYYRPSRERSEHPDAIVGLNAGLGSYISWQHVLLRSMEFDIPFAITDYALACLINSETTMNVLYQALTSTLPAPKGEMIAVQATMQKVLKESEIADEKVATALKRERPGKLNMFMQPISKRMDLSRICPGSRNACIQVLTPGKGRGSLV
ncbi:zinc finger MYND domain-containing protein 15 [Favolaschia claudopus]|uniref:Zinc finger MYND domain-containing protein 15 n=1 Tax=Favolaschia claudopus TaxID=2862362 RepID=A0AAW0BH32_9AGAR